VVVAVTVAAAAVVVFTHESRYCCSAS